MEEASGWSRASQRTAAGPELRERMEVVWGKGLVGFEQEWQDPAYVW
jgi:hypothetical protein